MRIRGLVALGLFALAAGPALAGGPHIDCVDNPADVYDRTFSPEDFASITFRFYSTAATGLDVSVTTTGTATVKLGTETLFVVNNGTGSAHVSDVFSSTYGYIKVETDTESRLLMTCAANGASETISQMQVLSSFVQRNMASSGVSFGALMNSGGFVDDGGSAEPMNFSPDAARATEALEAIDGTFSLLGYGPNALLNGDAVLMRGEDWRIKGIVKGSFAEADVTGGKLTQTEATASLLLSGRLDADLSYALSVTAGFGNAEAPDQSDTSRKIVIDGAVAVPLDEALDLLLGANWGIAHHEVDLGTATAGYNEQMASASVALRGEQHYGAVTLVPTLAANLGYGNLPDFTDSASVDHAGGTSLIASADAGLKVSYDFIADDSAGTVVSPFAGVTLSAYRQSFDENGGDTIIADGLGAELELGVTTDLGGGAQAGLSGTIERRGDTTTASISGSLSSSF